MHLTVQCPWRYCNSHSTKKKCIFVYCYGTLIATIMKAAGVNVVPSADSQYDGDKFDHLWDIKSYGVTWSRTERLRLIRYCGWVCTKHWLELFVMVLLIAAIRRLTVIWSQRQSYKHTHIICNKHFTFINHRFHRYMTISSVYTLDPATTKVCVTTSR